MSSSRGGTANELAIETSGLVKTLGRTRAVDGVDLAIARGDVHAVLGPNGPGRTTVLRMLATLTRPDAGTARVLGRDIVSDSEEVRRRVSLTGQFASLDEDLTGLDPRSRNEVWDIVRAMVSGGTTVLLTTQHPEEADQLADR